jgi:GT2 family glycosyltransferase
VDRPRASIVVVSAVNALGLERCLRSISPQATLDVSFETIVVLNGADDDVRALVDEGRPGVKIVESLVNRGFAGGCNLGRRAANGEFVVLLHDDSEAEEGWLAELVRCADEHPEAGAVGSRVLHPDGRLQLAGAVLWRDGTTTSVGPDQPDGYLERRPVDYAGSCSLLVRAATWDAVGGLDERFYPAYFVDVDLAMSIRRLGQLVLYEPRSRIRHHKGASTSPRFRAFIAARNRELFQSKWARELQLQDERSETLDRAFERTHREAERFRTELPRPAPPPSTDPVDTVDAERHFLRLDRELRESFVAELANEVAAVQAALRAKEAELADLHTQPERLRTDPPAPGTIGLRARLAGLTRAISRRATPSRKG